MAEALGCHGEYVEDPGQIRPALERAFKRGQPALVNVQDGLPRSRHDGGLLQLLDVS